MRTRTIDDYIDAAKAGASLSSDRKLSIVLGITHVSVNAWRQKRAWPKDEMIIRLAELAGLDPDEALIDLNRWRAKDPTAQKRYAQFEAAAAQRRRDSPRRNSDGSFICQ